MLTRTINSHLKDFKLWQHCTLELKIAFIQTMRGRTLDRAALDTAFIWFHEGWKQADIKRLNDTCSQINTDEPGAIQFMGG